MKLEALLERAVVDATALSRAWELNPHPRIAALLDRLHPADAFEGDIDAWCLAARKLKPAERGPLIRVMFDGKLDDVRRRLELSADWRDPRLSNQLERVLREVPWSSNISRPVWKRLLALVSGSRDPRFPLLAKELPATWTVRSSQREWLAAALNAAVEGLPELQPLSTAEAALLQRLEPAPPAPPRSGPVGLSNIYAAPRDDTLRHVLADALLEKGDPRGEFLLLQLRTDQKSPSELKHEKALLQAHGKAWLSPFGPALGVNVTWRRGFPAEGLVKFRNAGDAKKYGALPEWATFESLEWSEARSGEHTEAAGFIGPAFRFLERADRIHVPHLLASPGTTWALRFVRGVVGGAQGLAAVLASASLPQLRALHLLDADFIADWVKAQQHWGPLEELGVSTPYPPLLLHVLAAVEATPLRRLQWGNALRFHRADDGSLSKLELLDFRGGYRVDAQLESLPEGAVSSLLEPANAHWTTGPLGRALERVLKPAPLEVSLSKSAAHHLELQRVDAVRVSGAQVLVSGGPQLRWVDARSLEVTRSWSAWDLALGPHDVLFHDGERLLLRSLEDDSVTTVRLGKRVPLARSGDGRRVALSEGTRVRVLELPSGKVCFECRGTGTVALDFEGRRLLVSQGNQLQLHPLDGGPVTLLADWPFTPVFLDDGRLASERDGVVRVGHPGEPALLLQATRGFFARMAGTRDGTRIAVFQPPATRVFDGRSGKLLSEHPGADAGAFAPDGTLYLATGAALSTATVRAT